MDISNQFRLFPISRKSRRYVYLILVIVLSCIALSPEPVQAIEFQTGSEERDYRAGMELLKSEEHELAQFQFQKFLETYPSSRARGRVMIRLAEIYYADNRFDSAALFYSRGLSEGNLPEELKQRAVKRGFKASLESNQNKLTVRFLKLLEDKATFSPSQNDLRRTYQDLEENGDTNLSYRIAKNQLSTNPDSGYWKYRVAVHHARRNQFKQSLSLLDGLGEAWTQLRYDATLTKADVQFQQGKLDQAEFRYKFLLKHDAHEMEARYGLAWVKIEREDLQGAKDLLSLVSHADVPLRTQAGRDLARIHRQEGNNQMAIQWYKKAIDWADRSTQQQIKSELKAFQEKINADQ